MKKYTLYVTGEDKSYYSRKDAAIRAGEKSGKPFSVFSPAGKNVYEIHAETPTEETVAPGKDEEPVSTKFDVATVKAKIAKLLAKAESTSNPEERDAFNAKAEKMMIRLGITEAELEAAGEVKPEEIVQVHRDYHGNYSISMIPFVHSIAGGFGNLTVLQSTFAGSLTRRAYVIGHKTDVQMFLTLLDSLALQVMSALHVWQKENIERRRGLTDMQRYVEHRSFIEGFGREVSRRLSALRHKEEEEQVSTGAALVLASKMDRITNWIDDTYGELKPSRGGSQRYSSLSVKAGREAGSKANLGGNSVSGKKVGEIA